MNWLWTSHFYWISTEIRMFYSLCKFYFTFNKWIRLTDYIKEDGGYRGFTVSVQASLSSSDPSFDFLLSVVRRIFKMDFEKKSTFIVYCYFAPLRKNKSKLCIRVTSYPFGNYKKRKRSVHHGCFSNSVLGALHTWYYILTRIFGKGFREKSAF